MRTFMGARLMAGATFCLLAGACTHAGTADPGGGGGSSGYYVSVDCPTSSPFAITGDGSPLNSSQPRTTHLWRILGPASGPAFEKDGSSCVAARSPEERTLLRMEEIPVGTLPAIRGRTDE
jgi:hypothetical protein